MTTKQIPRLSRHPITRNRLFKIPVVFRIVILLSISLLAFTSLTIAEEIPDNPVQAPEIMTWVTLSRTDIWKAKLEATYGGPYYPKNTITRIGAQFFNINPDGSISEPKSNKDLLWLQNFCRANDIRLLLCFTNFNAKGFEWNLAVSAFYSNKDALINNMIRLVEKWSADGIDIDFEGAVKDNPYRIEFANFIKELSTRLRQNGKLLTVDSFPYIWSAPNVNWWADWAGYVDCVHSMGYDSLCGGSPTEWRTYKWQQDQALNAGLRNHQLALGMAGNLSAYGEGGLGTGIMDHLRENLCGDYNSQPSSVCIWSASFGGKAWETPEVWEVLHQLRTKGCSAVQPENSPPESDNPKIQPPSAPENLICRDKTSRSITLEWTAPKSHRGVVYVIYLDSKIVGLTSYTDFKATGLAANTTYCFTVKARNEAGEAVATLTVTTGNNTPD